MDLYYSNHIKASKYYVKIVNDISRYVSPVCDVVEKSINEVEIAYNDIISTELDALDIYNKTIYDLISVFEEYMGNSTDLFSFLNCKFMGTNIFVTLKYIKESIGKNFLSMGLTFIFAAIFMMLAVIFNILEIVIINQSEYEMKRRREREEQYNLSTGRVIRFISYRSGLLPSNSDKF